MTTIRQRKAQAATNTVTAYMKAHSGAFLRITDVCAGTGLPVPAVNNALRQLYNMGVVVSEMRRKRGNGKRYPVYLYYNRQVPAGLPAWMSPPVPRFSDEQIKGARTVLGFTGNLGIKAALNKRNAA